MAGNKRKQMEPQQTKVPVEWLDIKCALYHIFNTTVLFSGGIVDALRDTWATGDPCAKAGPATI